MKAYTVRQDVVEIRYWQLCWLESSLPDKNQFAKSLDGISYSAVITREPGLSQILSCVFGTVVSIFPKVCVLVDEGGDAIMGLGKFPGLMFGNLEVKSAHVSPIRISVRDLVSQGSPVTIDPASAITVRFGSKIGKC